MSGIEAAITTASVAKGVTAVAAIASTVMTVAAAQRQAQAQQGMMNYQAGVAKMNAGIAESQGEAAADAQSRDAQRRISAAMAAYGAAGVEGGVGSPVDVLGESVRNATLDRLTTQYNYKLRALGMNAQADQYSMGAANAKSEGYMKSASALIGGASGMIQKFG